MRRQTVSMFCLVVLVMLLSLVSLSACGGTETNQNNDQSLAQSPTPSEQEAVLAPTPTVNSSESETPDQEGIQPAEDPVHCDRFDSMAFSHDLYTDPSFANSIYTVFNFGEEVPGEVYVPEDDPLPYNYAATLGSSASTDCYGWGMEGLKCDWNQLDPAVFGSTQTLSLLVSECVFPIYQAEVDILPASEDRCAVFDDLPMVLHVSNPSTNLLLSVAMTGGVPGLEVIYDDLPASYRASLYNYADGSYQSTTDCGLYSGYPGRIYCSFSVPAHYINTTLKMMLQYDGCAAPVFSQDFRVVISTQSEENGEEAAACTGTETNIYFCEAHGGVWSGPATNVGTCTCP